MTASGLGGSDESWSNRIEHNVGTGPNTGKLTRSRRLANKGRARLALGIERARHMRARGRGAARVAAHGVSLPVLPDRRWLVDRRSHQRLEPARLCRAA